MGRKTKTETDRLTDKRDRQDLLSYLQRYTLFICIYSEFSYLKGSLHSRRSEWVKDVFWQLKLYFDSQIWYRLSITYRLLRQAKEGNKRVSVYSVVLILRITPTSRHKGKATKESKKERTKKRFRKTLGFFTGKVTEPLLLCHSYELAFYNKIPETWDSNWKEPLKKTKEMRREKRFEKDASIRDRKISWLLLFSSVSRISNISDFISSCQKPLPQ